MLHLICTGNIGTQHIASWCGGVGAGWVKTSKLYYLLVLSTRLERHFLLKNTQALYPTLWNIIICILQNNNIMNYWEKENLLWNFVTASSLGGWWNEPHNRSGRTRLLLHPPRFSIAWWTDGIYILGKLLLTMLECSNKNSNCWLTVSTLNRNFAYYVAPFSVFGRVWSTFFHLCLSLSYSFHCNAMLLDAICWITNTNMIMQVCSLVYTCTLINGHTSPTCLNM